MEGMWGLLQSAFHSRIKPTPIGEKWMTCAHSERRQNFPVASTLIALFFLLKADAGLKSRIKISQTAESFPIHPGLARAFFNPLSSCLASPSRQH